MPTPRAVAFDLDGLMFNTEDVYRRVGTELLGRRGRQFDEELNDAIMGRPPRVCFELMIQWHSLDDTWEQLQAESEEIFLKRLKQGIRPMPGLMELLQVLETRDTPKAICTSSSRKILRAVLATYEMEPRFRFSLTADDITRGKPDPEIYLKAAERFELRPEEVLVLEDSQTGCQAAARAGTFAVAVPNGPSLHHDFTSASLVIRSLTDQSLYDVLGLERAA